MTMQKHTRIYMAFFGYQIASDVVSEISGSPAHDTHHIDGRGKGKDTIKNLIALTRDEHDGVHWRSEYSKEELTEIHLEFMARHGKFKIK